MGELPRSGTLLVVDRPNAEGTRAPPDRESESSSTANKRLRIVTRCGTLDELIATFGPFADESSLFIVTNKPRPLGLRQPFVIQLREGETVMRGDVEVIDSIADGRGPDGRNGMRLKLLQGDDATRDVLRKLFEYGLTKRAQSAITVMPPPPTAKPPAPPVIAEGATKPAGAAPPAAAAPPATVAPKAASHEEAGPSSRGPTELQLPGERAPGSSYQLPANPFEGVTAEALESFVECTLYEERVPRAAEGDAFADAPPPSRSGSGLSSFPTSVVTAPATLAPPGSLAMPPLPAMPPPPAMHALPPPPPTFGLGPPGLPADHAGMSGAIGTPEPLPQRKSRVGWFAATAVASSIASLAAAYFLWGHGPSDVPTSGTATPTASSVAAPERTGAPVPAATATATATASAAATAAPSIPALKRECKANIRSYPQGAAILWNGDSLGTTPLADTPVPCGPAKVTFDLAGYEHGERSAGAVVGKAAGVFLRLVPTLVPVDVTSTPPGAQVLVDGRTVGRTPASITMFAMREATVAVALPRHKPWSQKFTPQPPKGAVHADLEKK